MAPLSFGFFIPRLDRRQSAGPVITNSNVTDGDWRKAAENHPEDLILESWSQGLIVGALLVMACITIANMRKGILLHKLILLELLLAMSHGTFCFMSFDGYGWYLSSTATLLYLSWIIHNIVAWMKVNPFFAQPGGFFNPKLGLWVKRIYLGSLALSVPVIVFQMSDNFRYFNDRGGWYKKLRPYEPFMRDPWWVFTCIVLFHVIRKCYGAGVVDLVKRSPRFAILLIAIIFSIVFTIMDIVASIHTFTGSTDGINPWWKLSLVFKCLTDTIMLDDFKTELKRLGVKRIAQAEAKRNSVALVADYPSGLDGPSPDDYANNNREMLYPSSPTYSKKLNFNSDLDLPGDSDEPVREVNPSPPGDRLEKKTERKKTTSGTNDPDAGMEELEFATALSLDPRRLSGVESVRPGRSPRHDIRSTTKKIGRLPKLKEFKFEAIKPGKKGLDGQSRHQPRRQDEDEQVSPTRTRKTEPLLFDAGNLVEERNRGSEDVSSSSSEASSSSSGSGSSSNANEQARGREAQVTRTSPQNRNIQHRDENHGDNDDDENDIDNDTESLRRVHKFRTSIGAVIDLKKKRRRD